MKPASLKAGDIVQISPHLGGPFAGCLMVATDPKGFGAQGYVVVLGGGLAYFRVEWGDMEPTGGRVAWIHSSSHSPRPNDADVAMAVREAALEGK